MKSKFFVFFLILAACFLAYFNSLHNPFIWDDEALVINNTLIRNLASWPFAFTSDLYFGVSSGSNFYRPLQTLTYMFDYHFWQLDPKGYHLTNIILQALVGFLVFQLALVLFKNWKVALASGLLFSVSPIHSEAVTYISGRAELLLGIFLISSFLLFIKSFWIPASAGMTEKAEMTEKAGMTEKFGMNRKGENGFNLFYLAMSLLAYVFALLSKELAVVFPFLILAYLFYCQKLGDASVVFSRNDNRKLPKRPLVFVLPYFVISGLYVFLRLFLFNFHTLRAPALTNVPFLIRLSVIPKVIFIYLKLLIIPTGLHMSRGLITPVTVLNIWFSLFVLFALFFSCFYFLVLSRKKGVWQFLFFFSLLFFIPQSGLFPINAFVAEHFIYLSSIPFFILIAYFSRKYLRKELFIFGISGLIVFYSLLTLARNYEWSSGMVFYQKILQFSPNSFQARNNLGLEYESRNLYAQAKAEYEKVLLIKPDLLEARSNLANLYFKLKDYKSAKREYAIVERGELGSKTGEVQNNIGNLYEVEGRIDEALKRYRRAIALDPNLNLTHFNLARIYASKGDIAQAGREIESSLFKNHEDVNGVYLKLISAFLQSSPYVNNAKEFYNNLGIYFAQNNLIPGSIICFQTALSLDPVFSDAYFNLGLVYYKDSQVKEAVFNLKKCLRVDPNHLRARGLLAEINRKK